MRNAESWEGSDAGEYVPLKVPTSICVLMSRTCGSEYEREREKMERKSLIKAS